MNEKRLVIEDELKKALKVDHEKIFNDYFCCFDLASIRDAIENAHAVDAAPVVHGHWITTPFYGSHHEPILECSVCHDEVEELKKRSAMKYCLTCGAKMDLEE